VDDCLDLWIRRCRSAAAASAAAGGVVSCCRSRTNADDSYAQQDSDRCSAKNVTRSSRGYTPMQVVVWANQDCRAAFRLSMVSFVVSFV
jgi:hypothetical protein